MGQSFSFETALAGDSLIVPEMLPNCTRFTSPADRGRRSAQAR
jgi:hypothetical protein